MCILSKGFFAGGHGYQFIAETYIVFAIYILYNINNRYLLFNKKNNITHYLKTFLAVVYSTTLVFKSLKIRVFSSFFEI